MVLDTRYGMACTALLCRIEIGAGVGTCDDVGRRRNG